ncbi:hypothetical protein PAT01_38120 [Pseudoalteromonas atlantica]|uniref:DUF6602 domain-containing protein n=1 Tax=Pseudoalteromonas atlantica TaxID=288 RepID=A0ABQ0UL03_PSEAF|nr:DUF6602 domain-containing protein [Pseudoalteromonas sp. P1-30]KPV92995.1 hypothetical protein AN395_00121 [Pseudoalteromonas sp. P1-30]GEK78508.1 hypothetical protein PAT01_38120 [Pseudoalteromonas atlantica]
MIFKASQLLEAFIEEETTKLKGFDMPHMPTLGSAYEQVTKQGIDQAFILPQNLNLQVVSGFISIAGEMLPEQIDCMLVHGDGVRYGLTDEYIYEIENILCIFEVKKTLRKKDYVDAFEHLGGIRKRFSEHFENKLRNENYEPDIRVARKHFSQITGKIAPEKYLDIHRLSKSEGILFYALVQESLAPVSIIQGYEGYKSEHGLRTAFINILEEKGKEGAQGLGVPSLPTLVTSNEYCIVKGNGIPFTVIKDKDSWVISFSTRHNPAKMILELIWSKISIYFDVKMPWDDGLHMDNIQPLLLAIPKEIEDRAGWLYKTIEIKEKELVRENDGVWAPYAIGTAEMSAINIMAMQGGYLPLDEGMQEHLQKNENSCIEDVVDSLTSSREFMVDGNYLRPINGLTHIITNDDGTGFVSSERDKFDLWCEENKIRPTYMNMIFME